jgi:hypothetical protein
MTSLDTQIKNARKNVEQEQRDTQMRNARNYVEQEQAKELIELFKSRGNQFSNENMNELIEISLEFCQKHCLLICVAKSFSNGFFNFFFESSKIGIHNSEVNDDRQSVISRFEHLLTNLRSFDSGLDENLFVNNQPNLTFDEWSNLIVVNDNYTLFDWHTDVINKANKIRRYQCDLQSLPQRISTTSSHSEIQPTSYIPHLNISIFPSRAVPLPNDLLIKLELLRREFEDEIQLAVQTHYES